MERRDFIRVAAALTESPVHEQTPPAIRKRIREQAVQALKRLRRSRLQARLKPQANRRRVQAQAAEIGIPLKVRVRVTKSVSQPSQKHGLGGIESVKMNAEFVHAFLRWVASSSAMVAGSGSGSSSGARARSP